MVILDGIQSAHWTSIASFIISLLAAGISGWAIYLTHFRKPKINAIIPQTVFIQIINGNLTIRFRNISLSNKTNSYATIANIWVELSPEKKHTSSFVLNFEKEKIIEQGTEKFPTSERDAKYSTLVTMSFPPNWGKISELWVRTSKQAIGRVNSGDYSIKFLALIQENKSPTELWKIKITLPSAFDSSKSAIGNNISKQSRQPVVFDIRNNA